MKQMVRKQIYIRKSQEEKLKRVAEARGVSGAEIIRRALENELRRVGYRLAYDDEAFAKAYKFMLRSAKRPPVPRRKREWTREELYEERTNRYVRNTS